jgi:hypothetical protein
MTLNAGGARFDSGVVSGGGEIISSGVALFVPGVGVISQGAALSGLVVGNTQTAYVLSGGSTTGTAVMSGGYEHIGDGGGASGTALDPSTEYVASGGMAIATSVLSGSVVNVAAGGVISNVYVGLDGTLYLSGSAIGTILSGGYVQVAKRVWVAGDGVEGGAAYFTRRVAARPQPARSAARHRSRRALPRPPRGAR